MPDHIPFLAAQAEIDQPWSPLILTQADGRDLRLVKVEGEFTWHAHTDCDEVFILISGPFAIAFRDRIITLAPGDVVRVPRNCEHKPFSSGIAWVYVLEPSGTVNTADRASAMTRLQLPVFRPE
jgi:mannose-6-phosphate isomerase-like protein (cupin superfamily)